MRACWDQGVFCPLIERHVEDVLQMGGPIACHGKAEEKYSFEHPHNKSKIITFYQHFQNAQGPSGKWQIMTTSPPSHQQSSLSHHLPP